MSRNFFKNPLKLRYTDTNSSSLLVPVAKVIITNYDYLTVAAK